MAKRVSNLSCILGICLCVIGASKGNCGDLPAENDNFASAAEIFGNPASGTAVIDFATREQDERPFSTDAVTAGQTVWWKWTAPGDGLVQIFVTNTAVWPLFGVFDGVSFGSAVRIPLVIPYLNNLAPSFAIALPGPPPDPSAEIFQFHAQKERTYRIGVDATVRPNEIILLGGPSKIGSIPPPPPPPLFVTSGPVTLNLAFVPAPNGDAFLAANEISSEGGGFGGNVNGAGSESGEPIQPGAIGRTVWFKWTAPSHGMYRFTALDSNGPVVLAVFQGSDLSNLFRIRTTATLWSSRCGNFWRTRPVTISARKGDVFYLQTDTLETGLTGNFQFAIDYFASPPNDDFTNRISLEGDVADFEGTNLGATAESGEATEVGSGGASVWYRWTASETGTITISTNAPVIYPRPTVTNFPSLFDTRPAGTSSSSITTVTIISGEINQGTRDCVAFEAQPEIFQPFFTVYEVSGGIRGNIVASGTNLTAFVNAGMEYAIAFDSVGGVPGTTRMSLAFNRIAPNDKFSLATRVSGGHVRCTSYTLGASAEADEPAPDGKPAANSIWWAWTAASTGPATITYSGRLGVYIGTDVTKLTPVSPTSVSPGDFSFQAEYSAIYRIALDTKDNVPSAVNFDLEMVPPTISLSRNIQSPTGYAWFFIKELTGTEITIDYSTDLVNWTRISTNVLSSDVTRFVFPINVGERSGFARAMRY
jgi:hypothetical protein